MDMPSRKKSNRALTGLLLTIILPPIGLIYLWREGVFRTRGRMVLTGIATLEMALFFALIMPAEDLNMEAPMPVAPVAATIAPDDGVVTALSNIDQLLAQQQAERDAAAGVVTPEPTQDNAAYLAEQAAILETTVYSVYGDGARYYHKDSVCGTQSNRRPLTVREAMGEGMGACAECDPPVYIG
jgi:hypothetical protein